ncbi:flagellar hook-associated protein FlgL [Vibrio sp.]|nr:flagellar hook-associated protein FlgL [Vibrio sp.]
MSSLNRISSFHNYQSVQNDLRRQETLVHHNQEQLASGKKMLKPSDDPLATHYVQNLKQENRVLNQFIDGIVLARNRLEQQETMIDNAEQLTDEAKRTVMEMINGTLAPEDLEAKAREMDEFFDNFMTVANTQDETGNYIFAGTKPKIQPFFRDPSGEVNYVGDDYQRKMKIAHSINMPFSDPGSKLFMEIPNPYGNYEPNYELQSASSLLLSEATQSDSTDKSVYRITFVEMPNDEYGYQLEQDGNVVDGGNFDPEQGVSFNGLTVHFQGQVTKGDVVELSRRDNFSVFDSFRNAIESAHDSGAGSKMSVSAKLHQYTEELHSAFVHLNKARTDTGSRLSTLDIQEYQHEDFKYALRKSQSNFEDLDYAQAVIEFNENTRALQASQQAFGKTKDLTLFNYL